MTHSKNEEGVSKFYGHPGVSSEMAREILRRLKFDNDTTDKVKKLVAEHDRFIKNEPNRVRRALSKITKELFPYFLKVRRADILAQNPAIQEERLEELAELTKLYEEILEKEQAVSIKELAIDGKDLLAAGVKQGKEIGDILNNLLELVLEEPEQNEKEILLSYVKENYLG